jgi:UDP-3-O-[3-hydroxymyristoyl] glucosamine N-acyltransferase
LNINNYIYEVGSAQIHPTAKICAGTILGKPFRKFLNGTQELHQNVSIDEKAYIGYFSVIGGGSSVGSEVIIDDYSIIESRVTIGRKSLIIYRAQLCNDVTIGEKCIIGGFIGERTVVENNCRIFGQIVHSQYNPSLGWDDDEATEESAIIEEGSFIGFNAIIIGGVRVGRKAYITAGTIITRSVPELHIAYGTNHIVPFSEWRGKLSTSPFFQG